MTKHSNIWISGGILFQTTTIFISTFRFREFLFILNKNLYQRFVLTINLMNGPSQTGSDDAGDLPPTFNCGGTLTFGFFSRVVLLPHFGCHCWLRLFLEIVCIIWLKDPQETNVLLSGFLKTLGRFPAVLPNLFSCSCPALGHLPFGSLLLSPPYCSLPILYYR